MDMAEDIEKLIEAARAIPATPRQREEHRRSFAFGNAAIENALVTRDMIDREADKLALEVDERKAATP
jgi:hypothetical protein